MTTDLNLDTLLILGGALWLIGGILSMMHSIKVADKMDSITTKEEQK
jgi:uncharacterized membrane protein HdeD (DUF308 family)